MVTLVWKGVGGPGGYPPPLRWCTAILIPPPPPLTCATAWGGAMPRSKKGGRTDQVRGHAAHVVQPLVGGGPHARRAHDDAPQLRERRRVPQTAPEDHPGAVGLQHGLEGAAHAGVGEAPALVGPQRAMQAPHGRCGGRGRVPDGDEGEGLPHAVEEVGQVVPHVCDAGAGEAAAQELPHALSEALRGAGGEGV